MKKLTTKVSSMVMNLLYANMGISYLIICLVHIFGPSHDAGHTHEDHAPHRAQGEQPEPLPPILPEVAP